LGVRHDNFIERAPAMIITVRRLIAALFIVALCGCVAGGDQKSADTKAEPAQVLVWDNGNWDQSTWQ